MSADLVERLAANEQAGTLPAATDLHKPGECGDLMMSRRGIPSRACWLGAAPAGSTGRTRNMVSTKDTGWPGATAERRGHDCMDATVRWVAGKGRQRHGWVGPGQQAEAAPSAGDASSLGGVAVLPGRGHRSTGVGDAIAVASGEARGCGLAGCAKATEHQASARHRARARGTSGVPG